MHIENRKERVVHIAKQSILPGKRAFIAPEFEKGVKESGLFKAGHIAEVPGDGTGAAVGAISSVGLQEALKAIEMIEDVKQLKDCELEEQTSTKPRKAVLVAIQSRLEVLSAKG